MGTRIVSAGEGLLALSQFVARSEGERRPDKIELEFAYGPACAPERFMGEGSFCWEAMRQAAQELIDITRQTATANRGLGSWVFAPPGFRCHVGRRRLQTL
jgi:hypothetical protein